jgi:hypothetical protein
MSDVLRKRSTMLGAPWTAGVVEKLQTVPYLSNKVDGLRLGQRDLLQVIGGATVLLNQVLVLLDEDVSGCRLETEDVVIVRIVVPEQCERPCQPPRCRSAGAAPPRPGSR